jgi:hypothetical protein
LACLARPAVAGATEYASASDVLDTIERREAEIGGRLAAIARAVTGAQAFARSVARTMRAIGASGPGSAAA